jgi:hypothetical protein
MTMNNQRKVLGWGVIICGGVVGITGLCLLVNSLLYVFGVLHLADASQDVPLELKIIAVVLLLLVVLVGVAGVIGGRILLRSGGKGKAGAVVPPNPPAGE